MAKIRVGIIGCGRPWRSEGSTGMGMANFHAMGYNASPDAEIVALCDINEENAKAFQGNHGGDRIYLDYNEMLAEEDLDMVSVCTYPPLHAPMVEAVAKAGVRAIHCEKPMADSFAAAKRMVAVCQENGVQLTIDHQRRFVETYRKGKELLDSGRIGDLVRVEARCPNLYDWGTHYFDMMFFYNDDTPAEWVIGQVEPRGGRRVFTMPHEGQGLSYIKFENGVYGLMITGQEAEIGIRLVGTDGIIDAPYTAEAPVRVWGKGDSDWQEFEMDSFVDGPEFPGDVKKAILDAIDALKTGREPELAAEKALRTAEVVFATYESSRRRGRVDLPLDIEDHPFVAMVESGQIEYPEE